MTTKKEKDEYDAVDVAERLIKLQPLHYDKFLIWWQWLKEENRWVMSDETEIERTIYEDMNTQEIIQGGKKTCTMNAIRIMSRSFKPMEMRDTWVQFRNKIVDFETLSQKDVSPKIMATNPIPWQYVENGQTPIIDKLFADWVGDQAPLLKEIMAYCLAPTYFLHRLFFLIGSGANGKSTFLELIRRFVGEYNCASSNLEMLTYNPFEVANLYKRSVCFMSETNYVLLERTSLLKSLSGGDHISFQFKYKLPIYAKNTAKIIVASNRLPVIPDKSDGLNRRLLVIDFKKQFPEKDILSTIPDSEYEALTGQCIQILKHLYSWRKFTNEGTIQEKAAKYEEYSNPLNIFITNECYHNPEAFVPKFQFRDAFKTFCIRRGHKPFDDAEVNTYMQSINIDQCKRRVEGLTNPVWCYDGISLKTVPNSVPRSTETTETPLAENSCSIKSDSISGTWNSNLASDCSSVPQNHSFFNKEKSKYYIDKGDSLGTLAHSSSLVHLSCHICQESPSVGFHLGKPVCTSCAGTIKANGGTVEAE